MSIDLTGFQQGQGIDISPASTTPTEQPQERTNPLPTLEDVTTNEEYQNLNAFRKAAVLGDYRNTVANYIVEIGQGSQLDSELKLLNTALADEVDKFSSLEVGFGALTFNPFKELKEAGAGAGKTALEALGAESPQARRIQSQFRQMAVAQSQFTDDRLHVPTAKSIQEQMGFTDLTEELEEIRLRAKEDISQDVERQGRNVIQEFSDNISAVNVGTAINQLGTDVVIGTGLGLTLGPAASVGYFATTAGARSDKSQRVLEENGLIDPRSSGERFARAATVGTISGLLERAGVGFLTNSARAQKLGKGLTQFALAKGLSKEIAEGAGRIGGAAVGEAVTELGQAWVETFGNEVEGFDEFIEVISDGERWKDAQGQALLGGLIGGMARGSIEGTSVAINEIVSSDKYQQLLKGKSDVITQQIVEMNKDKQDAINAVEGFDKAVERGEDLQEFVSRLNGGLSIGKSDLLSKEGAQEQGEVHPIRPLIEDQLGQLLENSDYIEQNNVTDQQSLLTAIVKDGKFNELEQQIDEMTGGDPNVDKEGIIFKAVNRAFNIPDADADAQQAVDAEVDTQVQEVPGAPQALRQELDAGPAVDQSIDTSTIIEPTAPTLPETTTPDDLVDVDFDERQSREDTEIEGVRHGGLSPLAPRDLSKIPDDPNEQPLGLIDQAKGKFKGSKIDKFVREYFTKERNVGKDVFLAGREREGKINSINREAKLLDRQLKKDMDKFFGKDTPPTDDQIQGLNEFLAGRRDASKIPSELVPTLTKMRNKVDEMTKNLVEVGAISGDLIAKVEGNLGSYLYRGYRLFHDPKWTKDKVPDADMEAARNFFIKDVRESKEGKTLTEEQVQDRVDGIIGEIFDQPDLDVFSQGKVGSKNIDILKKRKEIPKEIRNLMGEIKDPRVNFASSMFRMSALLGNQKFLTDLKGIGLEQGFLSETKTGKHVRQYSSKSSRTTDPLNGMYIDPEMDDALNDIYNPKQVGDFLRTALKVTGFAKVAKTALSPSSQIRNAIANQLFMVAGGYGKGKIWKSAGKTVQNNLGFDTKSNEVNEDVMRESIRYYTELGILDDSINLGEVANILKDSNQRNESIQEYYGNAPFRWIKQGYNKALELYAAGDDFFKIVAFEHEKARYNEAGIEKTDREVAEIVTDIMPTYSKTSKSIDIIRKIPFIGTFPSFPSEILRTTTNHLRLALEESKSDNPKEKAIGYRRLLRLGLTISLPSAVTAMIHQSLGVDVDEDEDRKIRRLIAPWSRYSNLVYLENPKDGTIRYVDSSFSDPFAVLKKPMNALLSSEGGMVEAAIEMASPFLGEDMVAQRVLDILRNKKKDSTAKVFEETDTDKDKWNKISSHVWKAFEPGGITSLKRVYDGYTEKVDNFGNTRDFGDEIASTFLGFRSSKVDGPNALSFKTTEYRNSLNSLNKTMNKTIFSKSSTQTLPEFKEDWERFKAGHKLYFQQIIKDLQGARALGVTDSEIRDVLKSNRINKATISAIMNDKYKEPEMSSAGKSKLRVLEK